VTEGLDDTLCQFIPCYTVHWLVLAIINLYSKSEMFSFSLSKDMIWASGFKKGRSRDINHTLFGVYVIRIEIYVL